MMAKGKGLKPKLPRGIPSFKVRGSHGESEASKKSPWSPRNFATHPSRHPDDEAVPPPTGGAPAALLPRSFGSAPAVVAPNEAGAVGSLGVVLCANEPSDSNRDSAEKDSMIEDRMLTEDDDSVMVMGMTAAGELVAGKLEGDGGSMEDVGRGEGGLNSAGRDAWGGDGDSNSPDDGGSAVSDDDYYKQDYYSILGNDDIIQESTGDGDRLSIASLSSHILDEIVVKGGECLSSEEMTALLSPDTPSRRRSGRRSSEGDVDLPGDDENPLELVSPAKKDYRGHLESMLRSELPPVLRVDEEYCKEYVRADGSGITEKYGDLVFSSSSQVHDPPNEKSAASPLATPGGGQHLALLPRDEGSRQEPRVRLKGGDLFDEKDTMVSPDENVERGPGGGGGGHARSSSSDSWFPFPASSPCHTASLLEMVDGEKEDFAAAPRRAGNNLIVLSGGEEAVGGPWNHVDDCDVAPRRGTKPQGLSSKSDNPPDPAPGTPLAAGSAAVAAAEDCKPLDNDLTNAPDGSQGRSDAMMMNLAKYAAKSPIMSPCASPEKSYLSEVVTALCNLGSSYPPSASLFSPGPHPGYVTNVVRLVTENHKLRRRRKELLALLSSTAQQFSAYERVCSGRISGLEEKIRRMLEDLHGQKNPQQEAVESAETVFAINGGGDGDDDQSRSVVRRYGGEIVRRLSSGVLMQEKQLKAKDELITQLKLRCEVLKQTLADRAREVNQERRTWEVERDELLRKLESGSLVKLGNRETVTSRMKVARLEGELETALNDITMMTVALERNNVALDATVLELDRLKEWKAKYYEAAASEVEPPSETSGATAIATPTTEAKKLRSEQREKDLKTTRLQKDPESSRNKVEEMRTEVHHSLSAQGYDHLKDEVDKLRREVEMSRGAVGRARERVAELEQELEAKEGEIDELRSAVAAGNAVASEFPSSISDDNKPTAFTNVVDGASTAIDNGETTVSADDNKLAAFTNVVDDASTAIDNGETTVSASTGTLSQVASEQLTSSSLRHNLFGSLRFGRQQHTSPDADEAGGSDYKTMIRQRDLKIKSLEAMVHSNSMIIEKLRADVEQMDAEREESELLSSQKIEKLEAENKTYGMQVAGFEKAFVRTNSGHGGSAALWLMHSGDEDIVDDNMFMWDENEEVACEARGGVSDLISKNLALQRMVTKLESSSSLQEDRIEILKAELVTLRVKSRQEKEEALERLGEENRIAIAQKLALEEQLAEINQSTAELMETLPPTGPPHAPGDDGSGRGGSVPTLVAKVAMLERANKILECFVESLRSDMHEKVAPLLERIALLEEEKHMIEEEMQTKLGCREVTIQNLESSLQQLQRARFSQNKKRYGVISVNKDTSSAFAGGSKIIMNDGNIASNKNEW